MRVCFDHFTEDDSDVYTVYEVLYESFTGCHRVLYPYVV